MSGQSSTGADLYSRPMEIDDGAYLRIRQIRPVERAAAPIVDHNILLTETAREVRPWYRGETRLEPSAYMSILLDPGRNEAVRLLGAFAAISYPANTTLQKHDLVQRIDAKLGQLVDSFRLISREFAMHEREIVFRSILLDRDAKADEILAVARHTNAVVRRIDARDVKRGKRQAEIDRQDKCWALWESGRRKEAVAKAANGKVTHAAVFNYFNRELVAMGVKSAAKFSLALNRRAKRLSKRKK